VATFDDVEYSRWMRTAEEHLRVAQHDGDGGFFSAAVLQAEQATQWALKALLHGVGRPQEARGHGLLSLAEACARWAGLSLGEEDRQALARLARDYLPTRYPDALPEGTPMGHYGHADAEQARVTAIRIVEAVRATWEGLDRAAEKGDLA
jgi:HEPN domain-containing protein